MLENTIAHVNIDMNSIFREVRELNKANKKLSLLCIVGISTAISLYSDNKKRKEEIKALKEELNNLKGE